MEPSADDVRKSEPKSNIQAKPATEDRARSPAFWRALIGQPGVPLPLFQKTTTKMAGEEIRETLWGPAAVQIVRWIVLLILGVCLILKGGDTSGFWKWITALK
jgi:hypothetical protein